MQLVSGIAGMNRDQHLQKQTWRLPVAIQAGAPPVAVSGDGRAAGSLSVVEAAAGSPSPAQRPARACPDAGQPAPVKVLRGSG
jgi:hypothetical protein